MPPSASTKLGPPEIVASIGKGIRVSAAQFREGFEREANAISSLNHSNIRILHGAARCRFWRPQRKSEFDIVQRSGSG
jgi:hypothetical protein